MINVTFAQIVSTNCFQPLQTRTENEPRPGVHKNERKKERKIHLKTLKEVVPQTVSLCVVVDVVEQGVKQEREAEVFARSIRSPHVGGKLEAVAIVVIIVIIVINL